MSNAKMFCRWAAISMGLLSLLFLLGITKPPTLVDLLAFGALFGIAGVSMFGDRRIGKDAPIPSDVGANRISANEGEG